MTSDICFLGVDAGATRCRARVRDANGRRLAQAEGPAANAYVDFETAVAVARTTAEEALGAAGLDRARVRCGLGVAGVGSPEIAARFAAALPGFDVVAVANDAETAVIGAHGGAEGGLVIAGTGSAGIVRVAGEHRIVGGRGFHLGDDGSAARLGLMALRAATSAADGLGPETQLTLRLRQAFDDDIGAMLAWAATARPGDFGAYARFAVEAAGQGDTLGAALVAEAVAGVAALTARVEALGAPAVALVGGLGEALRPFFGADLSARLLAPRYDATDGAILMVGGRVE